MKISLIVIFNHKFERNLEVLEKLYAGRFYQIYYIMPFYTGDNKKVISVYENSYYFEGYIAQAFKTFYNPEIDYYYFISDDLILNPNINESNFKKVLDLTDREAYIPELKQLHSQDLYWRWTKEAFEFNMKRKGVESISELPSMDEAKKHFLRHRLEIKKLRFKQVYKLKMSKFKNERFSQFVPFHIWLKELVRYCKNGFKFELNYPFCGGYADTFAIPAYAIEKFTHFCGVFAANELFAELAIPTAMIFSSDKIKVEQNLRIKGKIFWNQKEIEAFRKQYNSFDDLLSRFPENCLYIHPIKLSKWI